MKWPVERVGIKYGMIYNMTVATIDTNVLVAGLRSRRGVSYAVLEAMSREAFVPALTVALCLEYEEVLTCPAYLAAMGRSLQMF